MSARLRAVLPQGFRASAGRVALFDLSHSNYDAALRLNPDFAEAFDHRGILRKAQGDLAGAREGSAISPVCACAGFPWPRSSSALAAYARAWA